MKAAVFTKTLTLQELAQPKPAKGEALIKVLMAGICNTDLEILNGYLGFQGIPGHEFVGIVVAGEQKEWLGKRVVGEINIGCGRCNYCLCGLQRHCPNRSVLGISQKDGAFAEYLTLPFENLHPIPDSLSNEQAVLVEPLAAALEILEQVKIQPNERVAIIGDGKLGLLIAQVLRLTGCDLTMIGKHREKLELSNALGLRTFLSEQLPGEKFQLIVEASGSPSGLPVALSMVAPRGTIVMKSTFHEQIHFDLAKLVIDEITLVGSRCGQFEPAMRMLEKKLVNVEILISTIVPLVQVTEAFKLAQQKGTLKVLLRM